MKNFINIFKNPKVKMVIILTILFFIYVSLCAISYAYDISEDISSSVFRLHVIANSDSEADQNLKYIVRDNLLNYMNNICANCSSKEEAITIDDFKQIALNTIHSEGYNYNVTINIGNFEFPTKYYGDISLPAGYYDALKVEIGNAKGQNWWCVMFPPLCFTDITSGIVPDESKEELENSLTDEEFAIIANNDKLDLKLKFKILEILNKSGLIANTQNNYF